MKLNATHFLFLVLFSLLNFQIYAQDGCDDGNIAACACQNAPILCSIDELDGYQLQMSSTSRPEDGPSPICPNTATATHNPTWFAFTAWCNTLSLRATFSNCTGGTATGAQLAVFSDCSFQDLVVCNADVNYCSEPQQTMTMNGLNIGQVYYIMLDGCNGTVCEAIFEIIGDCGVEEISPWPDRNIYGDNTVCLGSTSNYSVFTPDGARNFYWYVDGNLHEESLSNSTTVEWLDPGYHEICVDVANEPCVPVDTPPFELCMTINVIEPRAGYIDASENLCSGQPEYISVLDNNLEPGTEQLILIVDENGYIIEEIFGSGYYWTPTIDGNYSIYSVNYSPFNYFSPGPGAHISELGCGDEGACCDLSFVEVTVGDPQVYVESQTNIDCFSATGSFTLQVNNASPPITYAFEDGDFESANTFSGLAAGTYTVEAQDDNYCVAEIEVTITEDLPVLIDDIIPSTATCGQANGQITVMSSADGPTYSLDSGPFQASNVFNGVAAGTHSITVRDEDGCSLTQTVTVNNVDGPGLSLDSQTNIDCATPTGSITVSASGGTSPLTYAINNGTFQASPTFTGLAVGNYTIQVRDNNGCLADVSTEITETIAVLIDDVTPSAAACAQAIGSISVSSSANGPTYSLDGINFQASNTFTDLLPGNYTVYVRNDLGCEGSRDVTVDNLPGPSLSLTNTVDIDCATPMGSITVSGSSGTPPLEYTLDGTTYQASSTFSNLISGNYTVEVRDVYGCTDVVSATINENLPPLIDATAASPAACDQATGSINITSSASGVRYSINNGPFQNQNVFTDLTPGDYLVTVINDQDCQDSEIVTVGNLPGPSISLDDQVGIDCNTPSGSLTVSASSGTGAYEYSIDGVSFQASGTFPDLTAGNYTVQVRDENNCFDEVSLTITEDLYPLIDNVQNTPTACSESTGSITVNSSAPSPEFSLNGGPFQTANTFSDLAAGSYIIDVRDANGCTDSRSAAVTNIGAPTLSLDDQINIDCNIPTGTVTVSANSGTAPYEYSINGDPYQTDPTFTGLATGIYTVQVRDASGCIEALETEVTEDIFELIDGISSEPSACSQAIGTITVNSSIPGARYSLDGSPYQNGNVFTDIATGDHTITVIDGNDYCETSQLINVGELPGPSIALEEQINLDCNIEAGSVTVSASSGTGPYQYSIDGTTFQDTPTFTDLPLGNYNVQVRDDNNCLDALSVEIDEEVIVLIDDITADPAACGQSIGSVTVTSSVAGARYAIDGGPFQNSPTFTDLPTGDYTITVIDGDDYCQTSQDINVGELSGPTIALEEQINLDCNVSAGTVTLSASAGTGPYEYSIDGINFQTSATFTDLPLGNHTFVARDDNACTDDLSVEIIEEGIVLIDEITTDPSACSQAIGSINVTSSIDGARYAIDGGPFQDSPVFNDLPTGDYTITVIDGDDYCQTSRMVSVAELPAPTIALEEQIDLDCNIPAGSVTVSATSGTGAYQYSIDGTTFQDAPNFTDLAVGNYTVQVRDENNCLDEVDISISEEVIVLIDEITTDPSACSQAIGSINVASSVNGARYSIDGGPFQTEPTFPDLSTGSYTITVIDGDDYCQTSQEVMVAELPAPTIALDNQIDIDCNIPAGSVSVSATSGTGTLEYAIDGGTFQANTTFTDLAQGNHTLSVRDENNCVDEMTITIQENTTDLLNDIAAEPSACSQAIGNVTVTPGADGALFSINGGAFQSEPTFTDLPTGNYTVIISDADEYCQISREIMVEELPGPDIELTGQINIDCITPTGTVTVSATSGTAPYTYSLDDANYQTSGTFTGLPAGSYTIRVQDANACPDDLQTNVTEDITILVDEVQALSTTCGDENGIITIASSEPDVSFSLNGGGFQTNPEFFNLPAGEYTINARNEYGCLEIENVQVEASDEVAIPEIDPTPTTCGLPNGIISLTNNTPQLLSYAIDNQPFQDVDQFANLSPGDYTVYIINEEDCEGEATVTIAPSTPLEILEMDLTRPSCGADDGMIEVVANRPPSSLTYFLNGQNAGSQMTALAPGLYSVTIYDADNCVDSTRLELTTEKCNIYVPNAFSPNQDGANDFFTVNIPENMNISIQSFAIYDRWGNAMFEFYPRGQEFDLNLMKWDGYYRGQPANLGVYVFFMEYIDERGYTEIITSDVLLMR